MPAPPLYNTFERGTDGAAIATTDTQSGIPWDVVLVTAGSVQYSKAVARGALSARFTEPGVSPGYNSVGWNGMGSLTQDVWFRTYIHLPVLTVGFYLLVGQAYNNALANCMGIGIAPSSGTATPGAVVTFNAAGALIGTGVVAVPAAKFIRLEWRVKPSTTVGEVEWRLYLNPDSTTISDTLSHTGQALAANLDRMDFGNLGVATASYVHYMDDIEVSLDGWIGPECPSYIPSLGRRPVPMIKGPSTDRILAMSRDV